MSNIIAEKMRAVIGGPLTERIIQEIIADSEARKISAEVPETHSVSRMRPRHLIRSSSDSLSLGYDGTVERNSTPNHQRLPFVLRALSQELVAPDLQQRFDDIKANRIFLFDLPIGNPTIPKPHDRQWPCVRI